jgi:hypothetical protein
VRVLSPPGARRFAAAWAAGALVAALAFGWMATAGTGDPLRTERINADFYELQARAILDGRLDLPPAALNVEAFYHDGRAYTYFPPLPALLRLPVVAVTDSLDGRLTALALVVAFVVAITATGSLVWRIRTLTVGAHPPGRAETVATALFALLVGVGTPMFFPSSRAWVYHEAGLWGLAFALCAFDQIVALCGAPTRGRLLRAGAFTTAAILSRVTLGTGPAVALGLVTAAVLAARVVPRSAAWVRRLGVPDALVRARLAPVALGLASVVPVGCYALVNRAKFGSWFGVPIDRQAQNFVDPVRREVLAANDGSLFTVAAIPTHVLALLRPDAIGLRATFPWIGVPAGRPVAVGGLRFDALDPTVSLTAAMPLVLVLAVVGAVLCVRRPACAPVRPSVLAAAAVLPLTWSFLYVAQRYAIDVLPLLLLLAAVGFAGLGFAGASGRLPTRAARGAVLVVLTGFVVAGTATGLAVALEYQRSLTPLVDEALRAQYLGWQRDAARVLGTAPPPVSRGARLPAPGARDALHVVGACAGLYVSDGAAWHAVERTPATGGHRLDVRLGAAPRGTTVPIVRTGPGDGAVTVAVRHLGDDRAVVVVPEGGWRSPAFPAPPGSRHRFDVVLDPALDQLRVTRDGTDLLRGDYRGPVGPVTLGDPGGPVRVTRLPTPTPVCAGLAD